MMARYPKAVWDPISGSGGKFTGGPKKVVHHKTQGGSLTGARAAYKANRSDPHFTVHKLGVSQHIDTSVAARSLRNAKGGVQTNFDGAIQIEVVGYSGLTADLFTMGHLIELLLWLRDEEGVPWVWPEGRPPTSSATGYGQNTGERHNSVWDHQAGHYGHSQVPENTHWDPAYTDVEWRSLNERMNGVAPPQTGDKIVVPGYVTSLLAPNGGIWHLAKDGAVYGVTDGAESEAAPYYGGINEEGDAAVLPTGSVAVDLIPFREGYGIVVLHADSSVSVYHFPPR